MCDIVDKTRQFTEKGEDEEAFKKRVIESFVSSVYLFDNRLLIYYNISDNMPKLAESEIALLESSGFDQRDDASIEKPPKNKF